MIPVSIETFPVSVRSTAVGLFGCISSVVSIIGTTTGGIILEHTEENFVFVCVYSFVLAVTGISAMFVIETNDFDPDSYFRIPEVSGYKLL